MEKYKHFHIGHIVMGYLPSEKSKKVSRDDMIGLKGTLFKRWKLEGNEGSQARSKGNEGSRAHSKGGRVRKRTTLNGRGLASALP